VGSSPIPDGNWSAHPKETWRWQKRRWHCCRTCESLWCEGRSGRSPSSHNACCTSDTSWSCCLRCNFPVCCTHTDNSQVIAQRRSNNKTKDLNSDQVDQRFSTCRGPLACAWWSASKSQHIKEKNKQKNVRNFSNFSHFSHYETTFLCNWLRKWLFGNLGG